MVVEAGTLVTGKHIPGEKCFSHMQGMPRSLKAEHHAFFPHVEDAAHGVVMKLVHMFFPHTGDADL